MPAHLNQLLDMHKIARDPYHRIISAPIHYFFIFSVLMYLFINIVFAFLYMLEPGCIMNAQEGNFIDHFFFSVQTISTIGYGYMYPQTDYAMSIMTAQVYVGVVNLALATGIVFARVSRPIAKVVFSNKAVVANHNGQKCLMLRLANERSNQIVDAKIHLMLTYMEKTKEGIGMRRFDNLYVLRKHSPLMELSWTVIHPIDESSPLYGKTIKQFEDMHASLVATLIGMDGTYSQNIYAKAVYNINDVVMRAQFKDMLSVSKDGEPILNIQCIHEVEHDK